jgi:naphthalene 1,2-dioxygenase ferredoxin reductase component
MPLIHIQQWPQPIEAGRLSILEAALDAGVPYPHGCSSGECGSCKSRLLSGDVTMEPYSTDALADSERAAGVILACRAKPSCEVKVQWLSVATPIAVVKFKAQVLELRALTHDVLVLRLSIPDGVKMGFRPGQFAKLRVGKLPVRSYSMANQPGQGELEFHLRLVPNGVVSGFVAGKLKPGDSVEVQGPFGDAGWQDELPHAEAPLLLLAGGTGLAPMLSVLDAALSSGVLGQQIHLYHGVRAERDAYAIEQLNVRITEHGFRFVQVFSDDVAGAQRRGFLHDAVGEDFQCLASAQIYAAGPPPMVDAVKGLALQRGAAPNSIRADAFYAAEPEKKRLWERISAWGGV